MKDEKKERKYRKIKELISEVKYIYTHIYIWSSRNRTKNIGGRKETTKQFKIIYQQLPD